jgi:hypothetical protein
MVKGVLRMTIRYEAVKNDDGKTNNPNPPGHGKSQLSSVDWG